MKFKRKIDFVTEVTEGDFVVLDGKPYVIVRRGYGSGDYTIVDLREGVIAGRYSHPLPSGLMKSLVESFDNVYVIPSDNIEINEV